MICLVTEKYERLMIMAWDSNVGLRSSETCLNQTSLGPTFVCNRQVFRLCRLFHTLGLYVMFRRSHHGRDRMVVGFTAIYAVSAYHH
jgi:hypothetical protein